MHEAWDTPEPPTYHRGRDGDTSTICALCREPLRDEGIWLVHPSGSIYGPDGHRAVPISGRE